MSFKNKVSGIYKITQLSSGRVYIGSSVNIYQRWETHKSSFGIDGRGNPYLSNAWMKHGENDFKFEIIETVPNKRDLITREQFWIDKYNASNRQFGFNIAPVAGNLLGTKQTKKTIEKRVKKNTGKKRSEETKRKMSKAAMGNKNGEGSHWHGVISESDIVPIFKLIASGKKTKVIADKYNVNSVTISRIITRKTWWGIDVPKELVSKAQEQHKNGRKKSIRLHSDMTKLTPGDVSAIKRRLLNGEMGTVIAKDFNVSPETIYSIKAGRSWKDIKPAPPQQ